MNFLSMSFKSLFYWITVADNAKSMFITFIVIFTLITAISTITFFIGRDGDNATCPKDGLGERAKRWMWWSYPFMILFWSLYVFTPSKRDALLIVAGGETMDFLTTDSSSRQIPHELSAFVVTELKNMATDAKVDLGIANQKDRLLDEAKKMTTEELLQKMQQDSNFAKIITSK